MAVTFNILNLNDDVFNELRICAHHSIPACSIKDYLAAKYNATPADDSGGMSGRFKFPRDKYVEFCLTWL